MSLFLTHRNANAKTYAENWVHTINVIKKDNKSVLWKKTQTRQITFKNMSDLTIKAIKGSYDTEVSTK